MSNSKVLYEHLSFHIRRCRMLGNWKLEVCCQPINIRLCHVAIFGRGIMLMKALFNVRHRLQSLQLRIMASILRPATLRHACMYAQVRTAFKTQAANPISISKYTTLTPQRGSITSRIARIRSATVRNSIKAAAFQTSSRRDILPAGPRTSPIEKGNR